MKKIFDISVYGRIAFFLTVSEKVLKTVEFEENGDNNLIKKMMTACWNWCGGQSIPAYALWKLFESEEDMTISDISWKYKDDAIKAPVLKVLVTTIMYTIFHALKREDIENIPESIESVDDSTAVTDLLRYAQKCKAINKQWLSKTFEYFLENFHTNNPESYGKTIDRKNLISKFL
ncbi:Imm6 family immunity protein [Sporolactobacillus sp. CQH2019]|uniref:Imm6 family immunity protein n=1 Tax=Sporolactobacillus sp. CQH2019 TaxID=3023512 RepID=UPI002367FD7F|nr:Imm6 family immunity protein [Sporolactobacillus sp. CQH2019]MDD9149077.1 Imm6 family immunity protein [Sporolactobacillus sp. CQH2019]